MIFPMRWWDEQLKRYVLNYFKREYFFEKKMFLIYYQNQRGLQKRLAKHSSNKYFFNDLEEWPFSRTVKHPPQCLQCAPVWVTVPWTKCYSLTSASPPKQSTVITEEQWRNLDRFLTAWTSTNAHSLNVTSYRFYCKNK